MQLNVLILEDSPSDTLLLVRELRNAGYEVDYTRVESLASMTEALDHGDWDIILSDYSMPQFSATAGLKLVKDQELDIPFIIVSGTMGEETAVEAMKAGASDYFRKGRTTRLAAAIDRELREKEDRERRRRAEQELRQAEQRFAKAFQVSPVGITISSGAGIFLSANESFRSMVGYRAGTIVGRQVSELNIWANPANARLLKISSGEHKSIRNAEIMLNTASNERRYVLVSIDRIDISDEACLLTMWHDITERKRVEQELEEKSELIQLLQNVTVAANEATDVDNVMRFAIERICTYVGWPLGQIYSRTRSEEISLTTVPVGYAADSEEYAQISKASQALHRSDMIGDLIHKVFASGEAEYLRDLTVTQDFDHDNDVQKAGIKSAYAFPILYQHDVVTVIAFFAATTESPNRALLDTIPHIATQVGHVIERNRANEEIRSLHNATAYLFNADNAEDLAAQIVSGVAQEFEHVDCDLLLLDPQTRNLARLAREGQSRVLTNTDIDISGSGLVPKAYRENRIIYSPDVLLDEHYVAGISSTRSEMVVPLTTREGVIGVLDLQSPHRDYFNQNDQRVLGAFAERAAAALEIIRYATELELRVEERTQELQKAKERVEAIVNQSSDAIILVDTGGTIQQTNPRFVEIFGYAMDELFGQSLAGIASIQVGKELFQILEDVALTQEYRRLEIVARRKDGTIFPADAAFSAVVSNHETEIVCSLRDISAQKQLEQELRLAIEQQKELAELKTRFISMISHEYRTPLSIIQTSSSLLMTYSEHLTEERKAKQLEHIQEQVMRLTGLLNDVLEISRAETVGVDYKPEEINVVDLCNKLIGDTRQISPDHTIEFNVVGQEALITADPTLIERILLNLLTNATKYSPNLSIIRVQLEFADLATSLTVSDEGVGIPAEDMDNLFELFHRAGNVGQIQGTGLGLAIVKQAVDAHGGSIEVKSEVGRGTTFIVTLPA